jgi:hypothetical protein
MFEHAENKIFFNDALTTKRMMAIPKSYRCGRAR